MKSSIVLFQVDAKFDGEKFNWKETKAEVCRQFDEWREKENPHTIFAVNFDRVTGRSLDPTEQPHYWYIEVLCCK